MTDHGGLGPCAPNKPSCLLPTDFTISVNPIPARLRLVTLDRDCSPLHPYRQPDPRCQAAKVDESRPVVPDLSVLTRTGSVDCLVPHSGFNGVCVMRGLVTCLVVLNLNLVGQAFAQSIDGSKRSTTSQ